MEDDASFLGVFKHHYTVEIVSVVTFLFLYEVIAKPLVRRCLDFFEAKRYNVQGTYITYYDDQFGSHSIKQGAELTLTQKGKNIRGIDVIKNSEGGPFRSWALEGMLLHGHMIAGSYKEISRRDSRSVGTFFVKQQENSADFTGFWCGWDEANNKLNSGEYIFQKKPKIYFSEFSSQDRPQIARLSEVAFGHNYFSAAIEPKLEEFASTARLFVVRHDNKSGAITGFSLCYMLPKSSLLAYLRIENEPAALADLRQVRLSDDLIDSDRNGQIAVMQTICLSDEARHRGVAHSLVEYTQRYLKKRSPTAILAPAWNVDGQMSAASLLSRLGYKEAIEVDHYWREDCDKGNFVCPSRTSQCVCRMRLFYRNL